MILGTRENGFSVLELLIVLSILGILMGFAVSRVGSNAARAYSNDLQALFQQARFEAIKGNAPIAVIWSASDRTFYSVGGDANHPCKGTNVLTRAEANQYPRVSIDTDFFDGEGLVWLPSGQARSCSFTMFTETIAHIQDERQSRVLTVSLTGKVTVE